MVARPKLAPLSQEARKAREPLPVHELVDARHDVVHKVPKGARAARSTKAKGGSSDKT